MCCIDRALGKESKKKKKKKTDGLQREDIWAEYRTLNNDTDSLNI